MTHAAFNGQERVNVWVDSWQLECCGEPFDLGAHVSWTVMSADRDYFAPLFPPESGIEINWAEEHHSEPKGGLTEIQATVAEIAGVQFEYAARSGGPTLYPVVGSARVTVLERSGGTEMRAEGFAGYLVTLAR